jgi:hypothetical protein
MRTIEMECYLARYFNWRSNLIVPNISWGLWYGGHEKDLFIVSECGFVTEVEIKISKSDLIKDKHKRNSMHFDDRIRYLYFAIPDYLLESCQDLIPPLAGILTVSDDGEVKKIRKASVKSRYKLNDIEKFKVARLGTMRIWSLKEKIIKEEAKENDKKGNDSNPGTPEGSI